MPEIEVGRRYKISPSYWGLPEDTNFHTFDHNSTFKFWLLAEWELLAITSEHYSIKILKAPSLLGFEFYEVNSIHSIINTMSLIEIKVPYVLPPDRFEVLE